MTPPAPRPAPGAAPSKARRFWRRLALGVVGGLSLLVVAVLFIPLPVAWAINLGAKWTLPAQPGFYVHVERATFRWRGAPEVATLEIHGARFEIAGQPLAALRSARIEIERGGLWQGNYAPRLVVLTAPAVVMDSRPGGALAALQPTPSPADAPSAPFSLASIKPALPAHGQESRLRIEGLAIDYAFSDLRWRLEGDCDARLVRASDDDATLALTLNLGGAEKKPLRSTLGVVMNLRDGRIEAHVDVPEFALRELPPLTAETLPISGHLGLSARAVYDAAAARLVNAGATLAFRDGKIATPLAGEPLDLRRVELRASVAARGEDYFAQVERGRIELEGAQFELRQLEATLGKDTRLVWAAGARGLDGARVAARLPAAVAAQLPWLERLVKSATLETVHSEGRATVARNTAGALALRELELEHQLDSRLAGQPVAIHVSARQRESAPVEVQARLGPLEPRTVAAAVPPELRLEALALPVEIALQGRFTPAWEPLDATVTLHFGPGRVLPVAPLERPVEIGRSTIEAQMTDGGKRWMLPQLAIDTELGRLEGRGFDARLRAEGLSIQGEIEATRARVGTLAAAFPLPAWEKLRASGIAPADFELVRSLLRLEVELHQKDGAWAPRRFEVANDLELSAWGRSLFSRETLTLAPGAPEAVARVSVREFTPAEFGDRQLAGIALRDFAFPLRVSAEARIAIATGALLEARAQLQAGPGRVQLAALGGGAPFHALRAEAVFDGVTQRVSLPAARLELAPELAFAFSDVKATLAPLHIEGSARIEPMALAKLVEWWPASLLAETRNTIVAAKARGALRSGEIGFALEENRDGSLQLKSARGEIELAAAVAHAPGIPASVEVAEARVAVAYPAAELFLRNARLPGAEIESGRFSVPDVLAAQPEVKARFSFAGDLAAASRWLGAQFALPPKAGPEAGVFRGEAEAQIAWNEKPTATLTLRMPRLLGLPLRLKAMATLGDAGQSLTRIRVDEFAFGATELAGEWSSLRDQETIVATAKHVEVPELLAAGLPWLERAAAPTAGMPSSSPSEITPPVLPASPLAGKPLGVKATIAAIHFGNDQRLRDLALEAALVDGWPRQAALAGTDGVGNRVALALTEHDKAQRIVVTLDDAAALARVLTEPARATKLPPGNLADSVANAARVPRLLSGGAVTMEGTLARNPAGLAARGTFRLENATMIEPPRVLRLLALRSGKSFERSPLIRRLSIGEWQVEPDFVRLTTGGLEGSGLIDRLKLNSATYRFAGEKLEIDGVYFGVGFEVIGTRADPQIFLKSNRLLEGTILQPDSGFFTDDFAPRGKK